MEEKAGNLSQTALNWRQILRERQRNFQSGAVVRLTALNQAGALAFFGGRRKTAFFNSLLRTVGWVERRETHHEGVETGAF